MKKQLCCILHYCSFEILQFRSNFNQIHGTNSLVYYVYRYDALYIQPDQAGKQLLKVT